LSYTKQKIYFLFVIILNTSDLSATQQYYERFIGTISVFFLILVVGILAGLVGFAWFLSQSKILFLCFIGTLYVMYCISLLALSKFTAFRSDVQQGLLTRESPMPNNENTLEILDIPEDKALAVCTLYHNGVGYKEIQKSMGFEHRQQVKRALLKGLDVLLKEHNGKVKP
jgi:hypothetical protein